MSEKAQWQNRIVGYADVDPKTLAPNPQNYRRHPKRQGDAVTGSLNELGWIQDVLVNKTTGRMIDGHLRVELALQHGAQSVPVKYVELSEAEERLALATLDPLTYMAETDAAALGALLEGVNTGDAALQEMIAKLAEDNGLFKPEPVQDVEPQIDRADELRQKWGVESGQMWRLGEHRIICGDCTDAAVVARVMQGEQINLAFTSPPYAEQRVYDEESGFKPIAPDEYVAWFAPVVANVCTHLASDGSWFVNIKPAADGLDTSLYVMDLVIAHVRKWGWHFVTEFCWERVGVPKSVTRRFKNQFEPIYQFVRGDFKFYPDNVRHASDSVIRPKGKGAGNTSWANKQGGKGGFFAAAHVGLPNVRGGEGGVKQGNYATVDRIIEPGLAYPGNRLPTFTESHDALGHAAAFPVGLPSFFVRAYTDIGDTVYEPFSGSGSTIIAAENDKRRCRAVEISPGYVAVAIERWATATGRTPERIP